MRQPQTPIQTAADAERLLTEYVLNGVANEIYLADEARNLAHAIGRRADLVNAQGYGSLFGAIQIALSDRQSLCIAKMFDPKDRQFPTRSIPAILDLLEENSPLWSLPDRIRLEKLLVGSGVSAIDAKQMPASDLSLAVVGHLRSKLPPNGAAADPALCRGLKAIREARNKVIAHNEAVPASARNYPTWGEAAALVQFAKDFLTQVTPGFLNLHLGDNASFYYPSMDATQTSVLFDHLFATIKWPN